jgi:hypothetical protein
METIGERPSLPVARALPGGMRPADAQALRFVSFPPRFVAPSGTFAAAEGSSKIETCPVSY